MGTTTSRPTILLRALATGVIALAAVSVTACSSRTATQPAGGPAPSAPAAPVDTTGVAAPGPDTPATAETPDRPVTTGPVPVAVLDNPVIVSPAPGGAGGEELAEVTDLGSPRVLLVTGATADGQWLQVLLPGRPHGREGWVQAAQVDLTAVHQRITVDLSDRELVLTEDGAEVLRATVAVGAPGTETPTGTFYITDKVPGGSGAYGDWAWGISGWSEQLTEFAGGDGQIGLHGTDRPDLLGQPVSHGCIRMPDEVVDRFAAELPLGVPVDIRA